MRRYRIALPCGPVFERPWIFHSSGHSAQAVGLRAMRKTLRDVRLSRVPQSIGACAADIETLVSTVNEAQQRLITDESQPDEGWWNTWSVMVFNLTVDNPYFTTPRGI